MTFLTNLINRARAFRCKSHVIKGSWWEKDKISSESRAINEYTIVAGR